ncbi:hypothetical protein [Psychrobacillus vulpis]|uniref:Uncharacterized protein n=1 Tax=Psychrobacillus vulpis TaxID=2325572 RepID=A0A544TT88_9BACI|nr:hypothetical protein [Psychrobacillus vulpis]TQR20667.1 hypothetical protein FG384_06110 [Psychrobacillus vulpis]
MKTKWFSNFLTSLVVVTLVFGTASFASAKGSDERNTVQKGNVQFQKEDKSSEKNKKQKEDKSSNVKKVVIKSKVGKTVEKRLNTIDSTINSLSKSINTYFGVNDAGTVDKEVSEETPNKKYNSYKGKLEAEINKLRAIDKQLASDKKKYKANAADFEALLVRSKELQQKATDEIKRVKSLAEQADTPKPVDENTNTPGDTTIPVTPTEPTPTTEPTI